MRDKYDDAVEYLTAHPDQIYWAWRDPESRRGGCLFAIVGAKDIDDCGCLTMIRKAAETGMAARDWKAYRDCRPDMVLTTLIRADTRLPVAPRDVTVEHLPIFAEWQRRLDVLIRGVDPETLSHPEKETEEVQK